MKHLSITIYIMALILSFSFPLKGQENDRKILIDNDVRTTLTFLSKMKRNGDFKKPRQLIQKTTYDKEGNVRSEYYYKDGKTIRERHLTYFDDNQIKDIIIIQNLDTTYYEYKRGEYLEIITGGIPGFHTNVSFYENGLVKSKTALFTNAEEVLFEYEYEKRKN